MTIFAFAFFSVFFWVCGQTGDLMRAAAVFPAASTDLWLAWLWVLVTGLAVVWIAWLFWEATYLRFLSRPLGVGLQVVCAGWWGWSSWQLQPPVTYSPLSPLLAIALTLLGIWGALSGLSVLLLLAWDSQRGPASRRLKSRGERMPWDSFFDFDISHIRRGPLSCAEGLLDTFYELREDIEQDAQPD